jgi:hypothetical protein
MFRLLTFSIITFGITGINAQSENVRVRALIESSSQAMGNGNLSAATYQSMEDIRRGAIPGLKGVQIRLEQPVCSGQSGSLVMINETGEPWNYKVIDRKGPLVTQGATGYNRKIGNLLPGNYLIQFVHENGVSVIDNFSIKEGKELELVVSESTDLKIANSGTIEVKASSHEGMEYEWDFGDGQYAYEGSVVKHVYNRPGVYDVKCSVGNFDCKAEKSLTVIIHGPTHLAEQKD